MFLETFLVIVVRRVAIQFQISYTLRGISLHLHRTFIPRFLSTWSCVESDSENVSQSRRTYTMFMTMLCCTCVSRPSCTPPTNIRDTCLLLNYLTPTIAEFSTIYSLFVFGFYSSQLKRAETVQRDEHHRENVTTYSRTPLHRVHKYNNIYAGPAHADMYIHGYLRINFLSGPRKGFFSSSLAGSSRS